MGAWSPLGGGPGAARPTGGPRRRFGERAAGGRPAGGRKGPRHAGGGFSRGAEGQASVEAAVLIPSVFFVLALLAQPACLLYTRSVMSGAAADAARLAATSSDTGAVEAFVRRRLRAVPEVGVFHEGGEEDWSVSIEGAGGGTARVKVSGHARPLPLMAAISGALLGADGSGVVLEAESEVDARAGWVEGSYAAWVGVWK